MTEVKSSISVIDIVIYLHDDTGIMFKVKGGHSAEARFLLDLILKEVDGNEENAHDVFSLWLVSDLLELQLKPYQVPFKLICYWEELLEKYVHCTEEIRQRDEAVLMLQRNVFASIADEEKIRNPSLLRLLYYEAKKNVIAGKYPVNYDVADHLAVIQAVIFEKENGEDIPRNYFADNLMDLLPVAHCKRSLLMNRAQNPENRLMRSYQELHDSYKNNDSDYMYKEYLMLCRKVFQYGSAFFSGQAEHPKKKLDDPIILGVNHYGVSVICAVDNAVLLTVPLEKLTWQFAESTSNDENFLPCLFLHFPYFDNKENVTKLLQIFSKSACLADNLIETIVNLKKGEQAASGRDITVDFSRLALMTFDTDGKKIRNTIRFPKVRDRTSAV